MAVSMDERSGCAVCASLCVLPLNCSKLMTEAISAEMYSLAIARMLIGIGEASFAGFVNVTEAPTY